jgi:type IV pilus assembly protein PilM
MGKPGEPSFWKKEITLGRKPKEKGVTVSPPGLLVKPGEPSFWKKEIALGRKPKEKGVSSPAPLVESGEPPFWKKEITFRRKPNENDVHVPAPLVKPEPVADMLRPLEEQLLDPIVLPPVTPQVSSPVPAEQPAEVEPEPEPMYEPEPVHELEAEPEWELEPHLDLEPEPELEPHLVLEPELELEPEPTVELPGAAAELQAAATPLAERPEPAREPSRRERKDAQRAADRIAKEQRQRAKQFAKEEKRSAPATHKRIVGLKIGASQIAAAQIVNKGGPRVVRLARIPLDRGVVVGGELRESEELTAALKTFFRKNKLPRNTVRLGISNNRIGVRTFEITGIEDPKQLANAIRFRAQETLPIPLDEAVLDYRILDDRVSEDGVHTRRVLLVVAHRELVERYVSACRKAGLKLVGIDLEAFALLRALGDPAQPQAVAEDAGLVCISIGHDRSTLAVSDGRVCEFTRVLAWGGSALDVALARVLDLTPSETEPVRLELSLADQGEAAGLDARHAELARRAMAGELQVFARELVASLRFYQEQPGSLGIGEILVTGGAAACGGLAEELARLIGVPVRVADPLARVRVPRKLRKTAEDSVGSLAVAVGLGIED